MFILFIYYLPDCLYRCM